MPAFSRLVRFLAKDGRTYYGDAILPRGTTDIGKARQARIISGDVFGAHRVTDEVVDIGRFLSPLAPEHARTVRCLGLNYRRHAEETNSPIPSFPVLFYKPATALAGPHDPIPVSRMAQRGEGLDYECELVAVVGKECTNVPEARALDCILGYAVGNDVSHRDWQLKWGGSQWSVGKGFDGWAPWGPGLVTGAVLGDPQKLRIKTVLNGETMQDWTTSDMIFSLAQAISFISQGTTLLPGDIIFTGTPQGVGMGRKPPVWLKDGDLVEVSLEGVGTCSNKVKFADPESRL